MLPTWVAELVEVVMRDFAPRPAALKLRWAWEDEAAGEGLLWVREEGLSGAAGIPLARDGDPAWRLCDFADRLQTELSETSAAYGEARPACPDPGHGHPLQADLLDDVAVWVCPRTRAVHGRVGELA